MLVVETVAKIRRAYFSQGKSIKQIVRLPSVFNPSTLQGALDITVARDIGFPHDAVVVGAAIGSGGR